MSDRLRSSQLGELEIFDLVEICQCLQTGWVMDYSVLHGGGNPMNSEVWITLGLQA